MKALLRPSSADQLPYQSTLISISSPTPLAHRGLCAAEYVRGRFLPAGATPACPPFLWAALPSPSQTTTSLDRSAQAPALHLTNPAAFVLSIIASTPLHNVSQILLPLKSPVRTLTESGLAL